MPKFHNLPRNIHKKPTSDEPDRLMRQAEVKVMLGVADSTLEQWRLKGLGPKFVKMGRAVRYRLSDVNAYIANLEAFGSTSDQGAA